MSHIATPPDLLFPWYVRMLLANQRLMARLKKHFNEDAIIELTALRAFQNLSSKFNSALDIVLRGFAISR